MQEAGSQASTTAHPPRADSATIPAGDARLGTTLVRVAWLAIALGFVMEVLALVVALGAGVFGGVAPVVADLVKQVSWSIFVCGGLALGTVVSKARAPVMGLLGLVAGPVAFGVARSLHKGTLEAMGAADGALGVTSATVLALVKALEYGSLGALLGWVGTRAWGGLGAHAGAGLVVGAVFGGAILALTYQAAGGAVPPARLLSQGVNEVLFPLGCALVLFTATMLGKRGVVG